MDIKPIAFWHCDTVKDSDPFKQSVGHAIQYRNTKQKPDHNSFEYCDTKQNSDRYTV